MFKSIKARLTITICGILLLVFSVQMAANFLLAEEYYVYQKTKMMKEVNKEILNQAETTNQDIITIIRNVDFSSNVEIMLADDNMNLIYSSRPKAVPMEPMGNPMEFDFDKYPKSYYKSTDPTIIKTNIQDGDRIRLLSKIKRGDTTYYMALRMSVKSISADMNSTNLFILYISSFAIIIGILIVYFTAKQFSKPIEDINKVAIHISDLDFSVRAKDTRRNDEIGSLARNINNMSDRLEENIQSLQEANKKLEYDNKYMSEIDEQRKELIANISHELKTPLAILSGYTEILSNDIPGIDKDFYYETIQDETKKMDILIKNLLNLSDFENRLVNLNLEEFEIDKLIERIYRKNELLIKNKGIISDLNTKPCGYVMADPMYIEVAINNYISNAISYTKEGQKISITVEPVKDEVVISVYNEGSCINEPHMDKLWNSFYREDKSRKRTSQNNIGLGLYIVRSIMNAHHGRYGVLNRENGVVFWLSIKSIE